MNRLILAALAALLATHVAAMAATDRGAAAESGKPAITDIESERTHFRDGAKKLEAQDYSGARDALLLVVSSGQFGLLSAQEQFGANFGLGLAYEGLHENEIAARYLKLATDSPYAPKEAWLARLGVSAERSRLDEEVECLTRIAQTWPDELARPGNDYYFLDVVDRAGRDHTLRLAYIALLNALFAAQWKPNDPFVSPDSVWRDLVLVRIEAGDLAGAKGVAAKIISLASIVDMRIDRRFDGITLPDPSSFDVGKAYSGEIAYMRAASAAAPDKLEGVNQYAVELIMSGKAAAALKLLDDAMARAAAADPAKPAFSDFAKQINWAENNRAMALQNMGRFEESLAQLEHAAARTEDGKKNVSQAINLGGAYVDLGRPKDALVWIGPANLGTPSPFGRMQAEAVRACAYAQLNDTVEIGKSLDYLKAHDADADGTYAWALLCTNDLDRAAAAYMASLENPDSRTRTLYEFQDFIEPQFRPPFAAEMHRRLLAVRNRPEVRAVIERYGRIMSLPFVKL